MEHYRLYHREMPAFLRACADTPPVARLAQVGMNCGCEYTAFPRFSGLAPYSRYDHSVGVALIVWHFTRDPAQAAAGLLHDAATPVFAHVVDFLRGDYLRQESTEDGTEGLITGSAELGAVLRRYGIAPGDACGFHRSPIADSEAPRLCADRLEYTVGNSLSFGILTAEEARRIYEDIAVGTNEDGAAELAFRSAAAAESFAEAALACSGIYVSDEDRYAMQRLSELLKHALALGVLARDDLYTTEPEVIGKLLADARTAPLWREFRALRRIVRASRPAPGGEWRKVFAKKRRIDPLVLGRGRVSALSPGFAARLQGFLDSSQDVWLCGQA